MTELERCAGLVFGFLFRGNEILPVTDEKLQDSAKSGFDWAWLNFGLSDHRARRFLENFAPMPQAARDLMLGTEERIQLHLTADGGWGILPDIERDFTDQVLGAGRFGFWLNGGYLFTARRRPLHALEHMRNDLAHGLAPPGPAAGLAHHQEYFVDIVERRLATLATELGRIEDGVLAGSDGARQGALGPLRRELSRYSREFSALRGAIHRATSGRHGAAARNGESSLLQHLPELLQDAEDFDRDAGALQDRARLLYEEIETRIASTTNRSLSALTVISTLLLPPTFVVGAFGMNVGGLPWLGSPLGFWLALGVCGALMGIVYAVLRRFRILP